MCNPGKNISSSFSFRENEYFSSYLNLNCLEANKKSSLSYQRKNPYERKNFRHVVEHNYKDHSQEKETNNYQSTRKNKGGIIITFPIRLHKLLEEAEERGIDSIISWAVHGRCFIVHQVEEFVSKILPTYFSQSKIGSFQRQLNLYNFRRICKGIDKGMAYYNEYFLRGMPNLVKRISRTKIKGNLIRGSNDPKNEPNFYKMKWMEKKNNNDRTNSQNKVLEDGSKLFFEGSIFCYISYLDYYPFNYLNDLEYDPSSSPLNLKDQQNDSKVISSFAEKENTFNIEAQDKALERIILQQTNYNAKSA